ncbi:hypothetical protein QAD02_007359 [Eretmocerus hayati]|uniref:Uncharacterized protein n=1 Tax=Eretmocerus hayati TaxID=131215 RepID=A0ACC2N5W0_9HYME|nr:hypothetical protein QAD02_007359 [Eretmocerus hayati]
MTGEIENGDLAVRDVADLLQPQYAIITGGKTRGGCPIITSPDHGNFYNLSDLGYQRLMLYLTSVPTLHGADLGFHLVINRRNDKWNSVKTIFLKISAFFSGLVHVAYVLRPAGFLQKAISEVSNKLFREDFKFRVIVLANIIELHDFIDKDQIDLEKFSSMTQEVSLSLDSFTRRLAEAKFPNNTLATTTLLNQQQADYNELKEEIVSAAKHGEALLDSVRRLTGKSTADRLGNVAAVERLLVQQEETERTFDQIWIYRRDVDRAEEVINAGQQLSSGRHQCPTEVVEPKCAELQRVCTILNQRLERRLHTLTKCRELMEHTEKIRIYKLLNPSITSSTSTQMNIIHNRSIFIGKSVRLQANACCTRGIELLAAQNNSTSPVQAIQEIQGLIEEAGEFHNLRSIFEDSIMPESKALVTQVLQRIEDVSVMCDKRIMVLKQQVIKPARPIQTVPPEPAKPLQPAPQCARSGRVLRKANTMPRMEMGPNEGCEVSSPENEPRDIEALRQKRGHVLTELLETECIYVNELGSIIKGYKMEMSNEGMAHLVPAALVGKADTLFGNLDEIYGLHRDTFLRDLENCVSNTELVALCFAQRRELFYRLYSYYCHNIPRSERLPTSNRAARSFNTALDCMLVVLKCVNDSIHQTAIIGFGGDLGAQGDLLLQGSFSVWSSSKKDRLIRLKSPQRHIFLYEEAVIFRKHSKPQAHTKATYHYKRYRKTSQIGLSESVKGDTRRFEIWLEGRAEVHTTQASSIDVKQAWVR